ncbi:hypothetical protein PLICRDRAFT_34716 [Plicaturopsis crispa FD-325 SS-3]|nr:hypothetical protein PLICRDRAFT_34716 [Plicaturopsis crispa FD-325 SS-3]
MASSLLQRSYSFHGTSTLWKGIYSRSLTNAILNAASPTTRGVHLASATRLTSSSKLAALNTPCFHRSPLCMVKSTTTSLPLGIARLARSQNGGTLPFSTSSARNATHRNVRRPSGGGRRSSIDDIPSSAIFYGIIAANGVIFGLWQLAQISAKDGDPALLRFLRNNFMCSMRNLKEGRIWTLLTSAFSHYKFDHILFNGFTFWFMALPVLEMLGNKQFLILYLGGSIASSLFSQGVKLFSTNEMRKDAHSHGASGAIYAVMALLACVSPTSKFLFFGVIPVPAWACVSGLFAYDSFRTLRGEESGTDHGGHVGGVLSGIGYFIARRLRLL